MTNLIDLDDAIGTKAAAELTGLSQGAINEWLSRGDLQPLVRVGRARLVSRAQVLEVAAKKAEHTNGGPRRPPGGTK